MGLSNMENRHIQMTVGILDIVCGAFGLLLGIFTIIYESLISESGGQHWPLIGPLVSIAGIFSITGGIHILTNRVWALALIGSICVLFISWGAFLFFVTTPNILRGLMWIPAIAAIVLTIKLRKQFRR